MNFSLFNIATAIEFIGAIIIITAAIKAIFVLLKSRSIEESKICIAAGAITGLDFKLAATLLKMLTLIGWKQIGMFTAIYAIRFVLKKAFKISPNSN
jgi:hypothetical protein